MKEISAIYGIRNNINGKVYIGASSSIRSRWIMHKSDLKNNEHINKYIQEDYDKYGIDVFEFFIIEECEELLLEEKEKYYIRFYESRDYNGGYNQTDGGAGCQGKIVSEETRQKVSRALMGNTNGRFAIWTEERKESVRGENNAWFGKHPTEETRKKISEAGMGRVQSPETREKIAIGHRGRKYADANSKFIGVCFNSHAKKWMTRLRVNNKNIYGGIFISEIDAARKYNELAIFYFGEDARLNIFNEEQNEK
jgi:group I intron endonuclease